MKPPKSIYSYMAAAALALITLFTFFVFQNVGPQSAIRRFHIAAAANDGDAINRLTTEGARAPSTSYMVNFVTKLAEFNATFEVVSTRRLHNEVLVGVQYRLPNGMTNGVLWHVRQGQHDWRVDCEGTALGMPVQPRGNR
jgi:hypothetical protein